VRARARDHVASLERALAEEAGPPPAPPPPVEAVVLPAPPRPGRGLRIASLATEGAGALLLAGSGFFAPRASSIAGEVDALGPVRPWDPGL
jgi:hypothetical protein